MMQGTLWFEGEEGKGTTFFLRVLMRRYLSPVSLASPPTSLSTDLELLSGSPRSSFSSVPKMPFSENGSRCVSPMSVLARVPANTRVMIIDVVWRETGGSEKREKRGKREREKWEREKERTKKREKGEREKERTKKREKGERERREKQRERERRAEKKLDLFS